MQIFPFLRMATPTIIQPTTKHTSTVIFLHGLGGTGMNYEQIVKPIAPMFPHVKIMLPSAYVKSKVIPKY